MHEQQDQYAYFYAALTHHVDIKKRQNGWGWCSNIAIDSGLSQPYVSEVINGKKNASFQSQAAFAKAFGYKNYDEFIEFGRLLLSGKDPPVPSQPENENGNMFQLGAAQFKRKEIALEIRRHLLEIEKADPDRFLMLAGYIKGQYHEACSRGSQRKRRRGEGGNAAR